MPDLTAASLRVLQRQLGAISGAQLKNTGIGTRARRRLLADNVIEPVGRSVYRVAGLPPTFEARLVELCLEHPRGFITGPTAGALLGLRRMPRTSQIHLCVPHPARFNPPNSVRLRQSTRISPEHVRALENGVNVASWARLAFDLAADLRPADLRSVVEQMLYLNMCTISDLGRMAREMCAPGRTGSTAFSTTLLERHGGPPAESHPELLVLEGLLRRGVPVEPQVSDLVLPNGASVRIDMAVPAIRWAVEVDVHPGHLDLSGTTRDKRRDRQLHLIDWQVERVTQLDLLDLEGTLSELVELYRRRAGDRVP